MKKIFVYDDVEGLGEKYAEMVRNIESIRKRFAIDTISDETFEENLDGLKARQRGEKMQERQLDLDEASMLIIDFEIWKAFKSKIFVTGEEVAYHARCFSKCGLIIGLNEFQGRNVFDLTLRGHLQSYADLNIWSEQLDNQGLWGETVEGFRPWYWPQLPSYLESFERNVIETKDIIESDDSRPISKIIGLGEVIKTMPRSIRAFIGKDPSQMTIKKFVTDSGNGLRPKDKNEDPESVSRIAVARISKWMERSVLSGQEILVDAPHLVSRYPSLLGENHSEVEAWNKTAKFSEYDKLGLKHRQIEEYRFTKGLWLSKPAWFWENLSEDQGIEEVKKPWTREVTDFVFCEDASKFYGRQNCKEFNADVDSPFIRRFIRRFAGVEYRPLANLL